MAVCQAIKKRGRRRVSEIKKAESPLPLCVSGLSRFGNCFHFRALQHRVRETRHQGTGDNRQQVT